MHVSPHRPAHEIAPPASFLDDRVHDNPLEFAYRIEPAPGPQDILAPAEEASVVLYPFDASVRRGEVALEVFAYDDARRRHVEALEAIARTAGWRVVDPSP